MAAKAAGALDIWRGRKRTKNDVIRVGLDLPVIVEQAGQFRQVRHFPGAEIVGVAGWRLGRELVLVEVEHAALEEHPPGLRCRRDPQSHLLAHLTSPTSSGR